MATGAKDNGQQVSQTVILQAKHWKEQEVGLMFVNTYQL